MSDGIPQIKLLIAVVLLVPTILASQPLTAFGDSADDYGSGLESELVFIHGLINYAFDPNLYRTWERGLLNTNALRFSYGSVSKRRLYQNHDIVLNTPLGDGWRFGSRVRRYAAQHRPEDISMADVGFERSILRGISLCVGADLHSEKSDVDGSIGVLAADSNRERYARLMFVWDDLSYDKRNDEGGDTVRKPLGASWTARHAAGRWEVFTEGKLSSGYRRRYSGPRQTEGVRSHTRRENEASVRLAFLDTESSRWEAAFDCHAFADSRGYDDTGKNFAYEASMAHGVLRRVFPWRESWRMRVEAHGVLQRRKMTGAGRFDYHRTEYLPGVFAARSWGAHEAEAGWFGSFHSWDCDSRADGADFSRDNYIDKVMAAWTFSFGTRSKVKLSLSHVVSLTNFGGGNMQYWVEF